jgi:hypothetical protein
VFGETIRKKVIPDDGFVTKMGIFLLAILAAIMFVLALYLARYLM